MVYVCALLVTYIYNKIYYKDISKKGFEILRGRKLIFWLIAAPIRENFDIF